MDNYPPGVTGLEYEIAGPTSHRSTFHVHVTHDCDPEVYPQEFEGEAPVDNVESSGSAFWGTFTCPQCGKTDIETDWEDDNDPRWED